MRLTLPIVLLTACDRLQTAGETVEGSTSPVVAQGIYLGLELPDGVDLSEAEELSYTALCDVFLAEVTDDDLADAPLEGAAIGFRSAANGELAFTDAGEGKYTLD